MSARTTLIDSIKDAEFAESRTAGLSLKRDLTIAYALSLIVALIMTATSVGGLLYQGVIYPSGELLLSFVPSDVFNLAVGLPVLLASLWLARGGKLIGLLGWPGALFYVLYMYIPYVIAVPRSVLFLPYLVLVALSAYTMIRIVASIDGDLLRQRLDAFVPAKISAGVLVSLAILIIVRQAAIIVTALTTQAPVDTIELSSWIADLTVAAPALLVVGIQLWRRAALGYSAGAGLLLGYGMLALSVIPFFVWQAHYTPLPLDVGGVAAMLVMTVFCFIPLAFFIRGAASSRISFHNLNATWVISTTIGVFFGLFSGVNHGYFEFLQGNAPTGGLFIHAIGEAQRFWPLGSEDAFTLIPNFMITGIASMLVGIMIVIWSIWFLPTKHGRSVFLGLFILLFMVGGGIGQVFFFIPAWAFATRMDKPLTWWRKVLPNSTWPFLSKLWIVTLVLATIVMLIGLEMAIFGFFPGVTQPVSIENTALLFVFSAAVLYVVAFISGFGHELRRMELSS